MNIKFHCHEASNFPNPNQFVRAFSYTDYTIEPHNHDFYEMNIVLGGQGIHQIEQSTFPVEKGDVFVIPPMTVHAYYNARELEVYHILLKKDFVRSNQEETGDFPGYLQLMEIEPFLRQQSSKSIFLRLNPIQLSEIMRELYYLEDKGNFNGDNFSALRKHTTWKVLYMLSNFLHEQIGNEKNEVDVKYKHQLLDTLEYIHQHFFEKITVDDLAQRAYLSRSTFLRNFEALCGCSPIKYLNQYRTGKAIEMLEASNMSKTEVAHACGFYDLSHMERSFKTTTKVEKGY